MRKLKSLSKFLVPAVSVSVPAASFGQNLTVNGQNAGAIQSAGFAGFADTLLHWTNSGLGVGIAVAAFLIGAGLGVAKNSALPMLGGIVIAAFLHWGPTILVDMVTSGATLV